MSTLTDAAARIAWLDRLGERFQSPTFDSDHAVKVRLVTMTTPDQGAVARVAAWASYHLRTDR